MSDEPREPSPIQLNVLPNSGKVEQLKREAAADPKPPASPERKFADRNVIDRALDASKTPAQHAIEEKVIDVLRSVFDPEIPVNIYELGLIYGIDIDAENNVAVKMTLTAPACPVAETLPVMVQSKIAAIPEVNNAKVDIVWDPPWTREMMSEAALLQLGML